MKEMLSSLPVFVSGNKTQAVWEPSLRSPSRGEPKLASELEGMGAELVLPATLRLGIYSGPVTVLDAER